MERSLWQGEEALRGTAKVIAKGKEKTTVPPGRETMANPGGITCKYLRSTRGTNPDDGFMKVKELIRVTSVLRNRESSTKINHSFLASGSACPQLVEASDRGWYIRAGAKLDCFCSHGEEVALAAARG